MTKSVICQVAAGLVGGLLLALAVVLGDYEGRVFSALCAFVGGWMLLGVVAWRLWRGSHGVAGAMRGGRLDSERLWLATLAELDVEPRRDDERDNRWLFEFQGGNFYVDVDATSAFSEVYYPFIEEIELTDVEEVSLVRRAINEANMACCPTLVYTVNEEEQKMYVHIVQSVFLMPQIPSVAAYLQSRLTVFFQLQRRLSGIEDRLRQEA